MAETNKTLKFFRKLDQTIDSGEITQALRLILNNAPRFEDAAPLKERVALILAARGRRKEATAIYERLARHYANRGCPGRCLATIQQLSTLQPDVTRLHDHFSVLYSARSPYLDPTRELVDPWATTEALDQNTREPQMGEEELLELAVELAAQKKDLAAQPDKLPPMPLLSSLKPDALTQVLRHLTFEIFAQPHPLVRRGRPAEGLYWSVSPDLILTRKGQSHLIPPDALIGANSFGAADGDAASYEINTSAGSEVLQLSEGDINALSREVEGFSQLLATLRRDGLIEHTLCTHELFQELPEADRARVLMRFKGVTLSAGETVVSSGEASPGLFLVVDGHIALQRPGEDRPVTVQSLRAGDVFGEAGLVSEGLPQTDAVTETRCTLLYLPVSTFEELAPTHPSLAKYTVNLARERMGA